MTVLHKPTLVLNKYWNAINVETVRDSLIKVFNEIAFLVDHESMLTHNWESWEKLEVKDHHGFIVTTRNKIREPEIVVLKIYDLIPRTEIKLSRKNILLRDGFRCQYTNKKLDYKNYTVDHVFPRSRGGIAKWTNLVAASPDINIKKGNRTPPEAGIKLQRIPTKPCWSPLFSRNISKIRKSWKKFLRPVDLKFIEAL